MLEKQLALTFHEDFANEGKLLKEKLSGWYGLEVVPEASVTITLDYLSDKKKAVNEEYYELSIAGQQISEMAIFFVIVLSTVQIIFFTESANAMMQADMGLKFGQLIVIFLIRTVIAIPIVSLFAHIIYG